jgi:hypothetical protein
MVIAGLLVAMSDAWHPAPYLSPQGIAATVLCFGGIGVIVGAIARAHR